MVKRKLSVSERVGVLLEDLFLPGAVTRRLSAAKAQGSFPKVSRISDLLVSSHDTPTLDFTYAIVHPQLLDLFIAQPLHLCNRQNASPRHIQPQWQK
jgi:hypothetical protein